MRSLALETGETTYVYLNLNQPIFQDRRVRQALLYALDRDAIVNDVLRGQAVRADSPIAPASWAYSASLTRYDANTERRRPAAGRGGLAPRRRRATAPQRQRAARFHAHDQL